MNTLPPLRQFHTALGATFTHVTPAASAPAQAESSLSMSTPAAQAGSAVLHYGDPLAEHTALCRTAGVIDLGCRSRLCVLGADRERFLNGQVTNNVKALRPGQGCYAALLTAKGKLQSDLFIYRLEQELLLDFEPGLTAVVQQRLEKYVIADDVQLVDVAPHYGLWSIQGPSSEQVVRALNLNLTLPANALQCVWARETPFGEVYLVHHTRAGGGQGFDLFVPVGSLTRLAGQLHSAAQGVGGRLVGWQALETARIEAGIPRFGVDMDGTNLLHETGLEGKAVSYTKGCYVGQEIIARLRAHGRVTRLLRGLVVEAPAAPPSRGDRLLRADEDVGYVTSAVHSPALESIIALGYVRREASEIGAQLELRTAGRIVAARVVPLPFPVGSAAR